jgi:hypothetical protein
MFGCPNDGGEVSGLYGARCSIGFGWVGWCDPQIPLIPPRGPVEFGLKTERSP